MPAATESHSSIDCPEQTNIARGWSVSAVWRILAISMLVLGMALTVYVFVRAPGAAYLLPRWELGSRIMLPAVYWLGEWLPSFAHSFAFSALTALALPPRTLWIAISCSAWAFVSAAFEAGQYPEYAQRIALSFPEWMSQVPVLDHVGVYLLRGTFDLRDLAAGIFGALLAGVMLRRAIRQVE